MYDEMMNYDARRLGTRFDLPFFLFQGESDVITLTTLATEYFVEVEAPGKDLALIRVFGPKHGSGEFCRVGVRRRQA
jgi:hypothetical protein